MGKWLYRYLHPLGERSDSTWVALVLVSFAVAVALLLAPAFASADTFEPADVRELIDDCQRESAMKPGPLNAICLLYTSPSPRDRQKSRMPSSA